MRGALGGAVGKQFYHKASLRGVKCGMGSSLRAGPNATRTRRTKLQPQWTIISCIILLYVYYVFFFIERAEILKRIEAVLWSQREEKIKCSCSHTDF